MHPRQFIQLAGVGAKIRSAAKIILRSDLLFLKLKFRQQPQILVLALTALGCL